VCSRHVGLVAAHLVMVRHAAAADLHPAVGTLAQEPALQPQLEVAVFLSGAEEFVMGQRRLQAAADDRSLFDAEDFEISLPAVEQPFDAALARGRRDETGHCCRSRPGQETSPRRFDRHASVLSQPLCQDPCQESNVAFRLAAGLAPRGPGARLTRHCFPDTQQPRHLCRFTPAAIGSAKRRGRRPAPLARCCRRAGSRRAS
jgi:hypothetical protein